MLAVLVVLLLQLLCTGRDVLKCVVSATSRQFLLIHLQPGVLFVPTMNEQDLVLIWNVRGLNDNDRKTAPQLPPRATLSFFR
jgi:hypothetical protein